MEKLILEAEPRTATGKANAKLRAAGKVPAVVYGHGIAAESIQLDHKATTKIFSQVGTSKLVELKIGTGKKTNVLFHEVHRDGRSGSMLHADLYIVRMDELIKTEVPLTFIGESTAVYQMEGTLVKTIESVEIECLPGNLPESLTVDISVLDDFEKTITLADLVFPDGVKLLEEETGLVVASVEPPRTDEEMAELDEAVGEAVPEGVADDVPIVVSEESGGNKDRK
ncbi:MAG: 50S ribosomal protein L25 [Candidatus Saccharibacteria bacterium]